jgi:AcrR family transcriptional regulator
MAEGAPLTRQGLRTRGLLLRAGRKVLEDRGYNATRINDITDAAGVSVGTFYTYFDSKEELFRNLLVEVEDEVYGELADRRADADVPAVRIGEANQLYLEAFRRNARFWAAIAESALSDEESRRVLTERRRYYRSRTIRALSRWQEHGVIAPGVEIEAAAEALGAMTERCAYLWFVFGEPVALETAVEEMTAIWLATLGVTPA